MSSQFVDLNADGYSDILCGSFSGVPQIIMGGKDGYEPPADIKDQNGDTVVIAAFWNYDEDKWDSADRSKTEGHCTSSAAVDWDNDGDLDLVLGGYYEGGLFLKLNEGTKTEPKFAVPNEPIVADGKPMKIETGLAAPRIVDWDGDGHFDILCGGSKGGVYWFRNIGAKGQPKFGAAEILIDSVEDPSGSYIKQVPVVDGEPAMPGSSYHIEPYDYDGDGDLDLLVGARSSWPVKVKALSEDEEQEVAKLEEEVEKLGVRLRALIKNSDRSELKENEEYLSTIKELTAASRALAKIKPNPQKSGDFVWLFERK